MKNEVLHARNVAWHKAGLCVLFTIMLLSNLLGQGAGNNVPINFCGVYHAVPPNGSNPDSIISDRFGNNFDLEDLWVAASSNQQGGCPASGYFNPTYYGNVPQQAMPVVCQVLQDVSNIVRQRTAEMDCGPIAPQSVEIQVAWLNFAAPDPAVVAELDLQLPLPASGGIGTPFYSNPFDNGCKEVALDRPFIKINGGRAVPAGVFDGRILINSTYNWNFNSNLPTGGFPGKVDLYSVLLHEVMHLMGYASRIGFTDAYSLWDQTLRVVDNYQAGGGGNMPVRAIRNPSGCVSNCWEKMPNFNTIALNSCSPANPNGMDLVVGDAALAPIGGNPNIDPNDADAFNGMLSHLSVNCSGQNIQYVMQSGIPPNIARRNMTNAEQQIFCALGYQVQSPTVNCNGCYNIAHWDREYDVEAPCCFKSRNVCAGETIEITNEELLCNDITNGTSQTVTRVWPIDAPGINVSPNGNGTGWLVTIPPGYSMNGAWFNYTVTGCDCRQHNMSFNIRIDQQCPECVFTPDPCDNLLCVSDFENFTNTIDIETHLGWPVFFQGAALEGSPDLIVTNTNNHYLFVGNYGYAREAVNLELQKCIEPGCSLEMSMDLSEQAVNNSRLEIWGSPGRPCETDVLGAQPINNNCDQNTACDLSYTFESICIFTSEFDAVTQKISNDDPNFTHMGPFTWQNNTANNVCFLTLVPAGGAGIYLDNIEATLRCEPEITCEEITPPEVCQGDIANISFQVCAPDIPECLNLTLVSPAVNLPPGWTLVGNSPQPFTLTEGQCQTVNFQVQVPANAPIGSVETITLSGTATGLCVLVEWSCTAEVTVIECDPPGGVFTCPCAPGGINIDASDQSPLYDPVLGGVPYSAVEAAFNFDVNNDHKLAPSEHNNCIAILGRLIIDENLDILNCANIQMQPCAEIVVGTPAIHSTLDLSNNTIYACEFMWRGITITPYAALNFKGNTIRDAQFAITAVGGSGIGIDPPTKMIALGNTFDNNHVGVLFQGNQFTTVNHLPFTSNTFTSTANLLDPCDANLFNYNKTLRGYAGVYTQGVPITLGSLAGAGFANTFSNIRNGVIGVNSVMNVYRGNFINLLGSHLANVTNVATVRGIGVTASGGTTNVLKCNFTTVNTAVFAFNGQRLTVLENTMNPVYRGVDIRNVRSTNVSDNLSIGFMSFGISFREVPPANFFFSHRIANNTNMFFTPYPGAAAVYSVAIDIDNAMSTDIQQGRITNNHYISEGATTDGIRINGAGGWDIDDNIIDFQTPLSPFFNNIGYGARLSNTNANYLYDNKFNEFDLIGEQTTGMSQSMGTGNRYCCNFTHGQRFGSEFLGTCFGTEWRVTDMTIHQNSLRCVNGTTIDPQLSHGNLFKPGTGTAFHGGVDLEVSNSRFLVAGMVPPDWPVAISTPLATVSWFDDGGVAPQCSDYCMPPMYAPPPPDRDLLESDLITAANDWTGSDYGDLMQWEGGRRLLERMHDYPELQGAHTLTDAYYQTNAESLIGAFAEVERQAKSLSVCSSDVQASLEENSQLIETRRLAIESILEGLATATTAADTNLIYLNANTMHAGYEQPAQNLLEMENEATSSRRLSAMAVLSETTTLPASNILEQNRKTVQRIYLQTVALGVYTLTPAQFAIVEAIAFQCPLEGGSAVYAARALYRLNADYDFSDEISCMQTQDRNRAKQFRQAQAPLTLVPNPANDLVLITGIQAKNKGNDIQLMVFTLDGKVAMQQTLVSESPGFSVSNLASGVYFCRIAQDGQAPQTLKLVVTD
ncbi:MAG: T9SS type A sorting domain-containing protein [Saprospiraceae bacterium]|nr:T9SS type A sorting domain-containing protein [Saprospiraceae bacterium]